MAQSATSLRLDAARPSAPKQARLARPEGATPKTKGSTTQFQHARRTHSVLSRFVYETPTCVPDELVSHTVLDGLGRAASQWTPAAAITGYTVVAQRGP